MFLISSPSSSSVVKPSSLLSLCIIVLVCLSPLDWKNSSVVFPPTRIPQLGTTRHQPPIASNASPPHRCGRCERGWVHYSSHLIERIWESLFHWKLFECHISRRLRWTHNFSYCLRSLPWRTMGMLLELSWRDLIILKSPPMHHSSAPATCRRMRSQNVALSVLLLGA